MPRPSRPAREYAEQAPQYVKRPDGTIVEIPMRALVGRVATPRMRPTAPAAPPAPPAKRPPAKRPELPDAAAPAAK